TAGTGAPALAAAAPAAQPTSTPPEDPRGLVVDDPAAAPGFVLFAPLRSRKTFVIGHAGNVLHTWDNPLSPLAVHLLDDGTLLRCGRVPENATFDRGGRSGTIQRLAKDSSI